jgi:transmembrane sensor
MKPDNRIEREAADWLARRDAGPLSAADQAAFQSWLDASIVHRVEFLRAEDAWEATLRLKALGAGVQSLKVPPTGRWSLSAFFRRSDGGRPNSVFRGRWRTFAAAAAVLLLAVGVWTVRTDNSGRYATAIGKVAIVSLPDGSHVTLNTDSRIRVTETATLRQVELQRGEAFFEVAHDTKRPFVVRVGNQRVVAVGTQFSVRREAGDAQVVVTEGQVRVQSATSTANAQLVVAGAVAQASDSGTLVQTRSVPQAEELLSWRRGILVFHDATLAEATTEFNRYNEHKIRIADARIGQLRIAGTFRSTNSDAFVRLLEHGYPLRAAETGGEIVLNSSP